MKNKLLVLMGQNIKSLRVDAGYTQQNLADLCDIDRGYLARVERGMQNISMTVFARLCIGLRCDPGCVMPGYFTLRRYKSCTLNAHNRKAMQEKTSCTPTNN